MPGDRVRTRCGTGSPSSRSAPSPHRKSTSPEARRGAHVAAAMQGLAGGQVCSCRRVTLSAPDIGGYPLICRAECSPSPSFFPDIPLSTFLFFAFSAHFPPLFRLPTLRRASWAAPRLLLPFSPRHHPPSSPPHHHHFLFCISRATMRSSFFSAPLHLRGGPAARSPDTHWSEVAKAGPFFKCCKMGAVDAGPRRATIHLPDWTDCFRNFVIFICIYRGVSMT